VCVVTVFARTGLRLSHHVLIWKNIIAIDLNSFAFNHYKKL